MSVMNLEPQTSADVYANRIGRTLNSGFVSLMISVGHRTRLFDMMATLPPMTSNDIAAASGLTERYVREWLAAMTTARIVQYDVRTGTYFLPIEYAAVLSRAAGSGNLAPAAQLLSMLARVEDAVVDGFHGGGGVMPEAYDQMHAFLAEEKRQQIDENYVETLLELMPGMDLRLAAGASVLDAGCGAGVPITQILSERFDVIGVDLSETQIELAKKNVPEAAFLCKDMTQLDFPDNTFDGICSYYAIIHIPRGEHHSLFENFYRMLKPKGYALLCLGAENLMDDIEEDFFGARMYWSHFDAESYSKMLKETGFSIIWSKRVADVTCEGGSHLFVLTQKVQL